MHTSRVEPMFIYVSGPYSASSDSADDLKKAEIEENIRRADEIAFKLAQMGHYPFVPHTMMKGWEDERGLNRNDALRICHEWVKRCDSFFFIAASKGAESEREVAVKLGLPIFRRLEDIGTTSGEVLGLPEEAVTAYLSEYEECAESYRHTYSTIWQAGALMAAAAAAIIAIGDSPIVQALAPVPLLAWYLALFIPMDGYGEQRSQRLKELERTLNRHISGLELDHFTRFDNGREETLGWLERLRTGKWRVKHAMRVLAVLLLMVWLILVIRLPWGEFLTAISNCLGL